MEQEADGGMTCNNNFGLEMGREIQVDMKAESLRQASTVGFNHERDKFIVLRGVKGERVRHDDKGLRRLRVGYASSEVKG